MPLEPLRSKVVGAGAPNKDATWLPAPSSTAGDLLSTKNFYFADRSTPLDLEAIRDIDLERIEKLYAQLLARAWCRSQRRWHG